MLQNAYLLAQIGADTAENERNLAEICQKLAGTLRVPTEPYGAPRADRCCIAAHVASQPSFFTGVLTIVGRRPPAKIESDWLAGTGLLGLALARAQANVDLIVTIIRYVFLR